jgi:hypothetical protein
MKKTVKIINMILLFDFYIFLSFFLLFFLIQCLFVINHVREKKLLEIFERGNAKI